jgi:hypothetical protein
MAILNNTDSFIISTALNSLTCHLSMLTTYIHEVPLDIDKVKRYGGYINEDKALLRSHGIKFAGDHDYVAWSEASYQQQRKLRDGENYAKATVRADDEKKR